MEFDIKPLGFFALFGEMFLTNHRSVKMCLNSAPGLSKWARNMYTVCVNANAYLSARRPELLTQAMV